MKIQFIGALMVLCLLGLLLHPGCKTAEEAQQYVLTVTVGAGVTGVPATGAYNYTEGDMVSYDYSPQNGYGNLVVQLDGATIANSGTIPMNMNHILTATAEELFDVRGNWQGYLTYSSNEYNLNFTFSGGINSGTVTGTLQTIGYGEGTYSVTNGSIEFKLVYEFGGGYWHEYTGTITNDNKMTGDWISSINEEGPWVLNRQ